MLVPEQFWPDLEVLVLVCVRRRHFLFCSTQHTQSILPIYMNMASDFSLLHGTSFLTSFSFTLLRHSIMGGGNHHPFSLFVERREEEDPEVRSFLFFSSLFSSIRRRRRRKINYSMCTAHPNASLSLCSRGERGSNWKSALCT